jgi:hypothetical protein
MAIPKDTRVMDDGKLSNKGIVINKIYAKAIFLVDCAPIL